MFAGLISAIANIAFLFLSSADREHLASRRAKLNDFITQGGTLTGVFQYAAPCT